MNDRLLPPNRDPFATLVSPTAAALPTPAVPRPGVSPTGGQAVKRGGSLLERLERWLWNARQRDLERALTSSTDVVDVENRLRERERKLLQRYY